MTYYNKNSIQDSPSEILLPTGKPHISFSESKIWHECSYRHKLIYIDKLEDEEDSVHLHYGSILHDTIEEFLKTGKMNVDQALKKIELTWNEQGFDTEEFISRQTKNAINAGWTYTHSNLNDWLISARNCLTSLPGFLTSQFGSYKVIEAEHFLYEPIPDAEQYKFKGYIDAVLLCKNKKGKKIVWLLDWKTASPRGWDVRKKSDFHMQVQLMLYKTFWSEKFNINPKDVRCAFVLLKKFTKPEKCINFIAVSVGDKSIEKSKKFVRSATRGIEKGTAIKNRFSCKFCPFKNTNHCK